MTPLRCLFGWHAPGLPVKRAGRAHWLCLRCQRLSPPIDLPVLTHVPRQGHIRYKVVPFTRRKKDA